MDELRNKDVTQGAAGADGCRLVGITLAINNMPGMLDFYSHVLGIEFTGEKMFDSMIYKGSLGDLKLVFCPAGIAGITASQNRHQLEIIVSDLKKVRKRSYKFGGVLINDLAEDEEYLSLGIYDPDKNSIVFRQAKV